jgi:hypothetical protein
MTTIATASVVALHTTANILVFPVADHFIVTNGGHAWAFAAAADAFQDAQWLARNTGKRIANFANKEKQR